MFELVDKTFDKMSFFVKMLVIFIQFLAISPGWNNRDRPTFENELAKGIFIKGFVGNDLLSFKTLN